MAIAQSDFADQGNVVNKASVWHAEGVIFLPLCVSEKGDMRGLLLLMCLGISGVLFGQNATIRGNVLDETTGEPIIYGTVTLVGKEEGSRGGESKNGKEGKK